MPDGDNPDDIAIDSVEEPIRGDDDLDDSNGSVTDVGGPSHLSVTPQGTGSGSGGGGGGGCFVESLMGMNPE